MKMYHVFHWCKICYHWENLLLYGFVSFFNIHSTHMFIMSFFWLWILSITIYIYIWFSCIIFFPIVIISLIKWLINYLTVKLIDDCYNAYSTRIAFFLNSVIANLQEPNWVGQTLYLFLQVSNIIANMILSLSYDIISYKFCTVQYLLLVN